VTRRLSARRLSATAFLAAILAFGLPFGVVSSCGGEQVHFTGVQLATFDVHPDRSQGGTLNRDVEHSGSLLAIAVVVSALFGLGVALSGRRGGGICAALGVVFMQLLGWSIVANVDAAKFLVGFWLALGSLLAAAILHLIVLLRERQRLGRSVWWPALGRIALVGVLPTLVAFLVAFAEGG
jgi:hypothetical protein